MSEVKDNIAGQDIQNSDRPAEKKRPAFKYVIVGAVAVLFFVAVIFLEIKMMTGKGRELFNKQGADVQKSFSADDEVIQKYFPFTDHYLTGEATELLGMRYDEACKLFGHTASDADFSDGCDGFYFIVKYDCDVTVDLHFKNNELYRVSVYSAAEDYDKALSAAEEKYGDMFSYDEETNKCCFVHDDSCDYWVWLPEDGRTHQQFISRYKDDIGYYVDEGFFGKGCTDLLGQTYMQICDRFSYEMSGDDLDSAGEGYFGDSIFRYIDRDKNSYVRFIFSDSRLQQLKFTMPAEKADMFDSIAAKADQAYGEPLVVTEKEDHRVYSVSDDMVYILKKGSDGQVIQEYKQYDMEREF